MTQYRVSLVILKNTWPLFHRPKCYYRYLSSLNPPSVCCTTLLATLCINTSASLSSVRAERNKADFPQSEVMEVNPDTLKNYNVPLAMAMGGSIGDLAKARRIMDNIDPYAELSPDDF